MSGSISVQWLGAAMKPPAGKFSRPSHFLFIIRLSAERTIPANTPNVAWLLAVSFTCPPLLRRGDVEIGAEAGQLFRKALVAAVNDVDPGHTGRAGGSKRRDEVAEAATEVG